MDHNTIGLIVIGIILLAIMTAFIFNASFRRDVIASEGEAAVLGLINVKGVIIVLLTAIFGAMFIYILQLESPATTDELTTETAIAYLQKAQDETYAIRNGANDDFLSILANDRPIGRIVKSPLTIARNADNVRQWNVGSRDITLGFVTTEGEDGYVKWDERRDTTSRTAYSTGEEYKVKNLDFWFRIDSIQASNDAVPKYYYYVSFGEGESAQQIKWSNASQKFLKTPDGKIYIDDEFRPIRNANWAFDYYVKFGAGQPSTAEPVLSSVEKLHIMAVAVKLE